MKNDMWNKLYNFVVT